MFAIATGIPLTFGKTSEDGRTSTLYEYDGDIGSKLWGHKGKPVEVTENYADGETTVYEYDDNLGSGWWGHRGKRKN